MKAAFLYINAGKGHYIPAKALGDSFIRGGHEALVENIFTVFGTEFWDNMAEKGWQHYLHHYKVQPYLNRLYDNRHIVGKLVSKLSLRDKNLNPFKQWIYSEKPDFIVMTNFIGAPIIPRALEEIGYRCPVYLYAADVFDTPNIGVSDKLTAMYFASDIGRDAAIKRGMPPEKIRICPFPLQSKMEGYEKPDKKEIRKKLGLEDRFTVMLTFGGEGVGDTKLLRRLASSSVCSDLQVVIVGGRHEKTEERLDRFQREHPSLRLYRPGFVSNMNEYLSASDIQVGKAGANSFMESVFLRVPCIVSQLLYPFQNSRIFLSRYHVGWAENRISRQARIIEKSATDKDFLKNMERNFSSIPVVFSSDRMRDMLISDYLRDKEI